MSRQGSSWGGEARDGSVDVTVEVERTRGTLAEAQATTPRNMERLQQIQRDFTEAKRAERATAAAATKAQDTLDRDKRRAVSRATTAPSPRSHDEGVNSRSERPGDATFFHGSV